MRYYHFGDSAGSDARAAQDPIQVTPENAIAGMLRELSITSQTSHYGSLPSHPPLATCRKPDIRQPGTIVEMLMQSSFSSVACSQPRAAAQVPACCARAPHRRTHAPQQQQEQQQHLAALAPIRSGSAAPVARRRPRVAAAAAGNSAEAGTAVQVRVQAEQSARSARVLASRPPYHMHGCTASTLPLDEHRITICPRQRFVNPDATWLLRPARPA